MKKQFLKCFSRNGLFSERICLDHWFIDGCFSVYVRFCQFIYFVKVYFCFFRFVFAVIVDEVVRKSDLDKGRRTVVEVRDDLHREIRKLALLNDLRIYQLANAIIEDFLKDQERVKALIKRLRL